MDALAPRAPATRNSYREHFQRFCQAIGKTPDELVAQRRDDLKSDDVYKRHRIEMLLKKHIADLREREKGGSISTQKLRYAAVRSFFDAHYMRLELRRTDAPSGEGIGKDPADKEQIKRMIDVASLKFSCLISFLKDSGWRLSDVLGLKHGDINDMGDGFWNIKKVTKKERVASNTFVGPETTELMGLYLHKREESGESITPEAPLFPSDKGGFYQTLPSVSLRISHIAKMAQAKNISAHSLRKFFQNTLENPSLHIHKTWIKQFMGKKLNPGDRPYVEQKTEKLFAAYKSAYNELRVHEVPTRADDIRIKAAVDALEVTGLPIEKIEAIKRIIRAKRDITIEEVKRIIKQEKNEAQTQPNGGCANGSNCPAFKEISEAELLSHLQDGWQIAHTLQNGKLIIRKG